MQILDGHLIHSASDLNGFSECAHLSVLEQASAAGTIERPLRADPTAELLARKGEAHETHHLERLRATYGERLVAFTDRPLPTWAGYEAAERESFGAMERGAAVIYQATFFDGTFLGRADFLQRVERPSKRWAWSYEVVDTKLALSPKPYFLVQLCNYSEHVERLQGTAPESAAIVLGSGDERQFRLDQYMAYYRRLKRVYLTAAAAPEPTYPLECAHCELCVWRSACARRRDRDDHLSLVAGIRRDQIRKLEDSGLTQLRALATAPSEPPPKRLSAQTFANLRAQATEQHRYRTAFAADANAAHSYSFRPPDDPQSGFARLPRPDRGDIFFDMEGDPMYRPDRALEYLFGVYLAAEDEYIPFWGTTPAEERTAFEAFVDFVVMRLRSYPNLHVYHYAPYETTALKRLMGQFGSRENEIDGMLRARTFVDLYPVVKQAVWVSQPSYSIKKLEALYGFTRATATRGGDDSIVMFESWLETHDPATLEDIRAYNEDDCRSTFHLREWLIRLRAERNASLATPVPWHVSEDTLDGLEIVERSELATTLLAGLPAPDSAADLRSWTDHSRARWLLGHLVEYHRREQKPDWWEHFYRLDHVSELIDGDGKAIGGLQRCAQVVPFKLASRDRNAVYTFGFPAQEHDIRVGHEPLDAATGKTAGIVTHVDDAAGRLAIKLAAATNADELWALVPAKPINDRGKRDAIEAIAQSYTRGTLKTDYPATLALLLGTLPQLGDRPRGAQLQPREVSKEAVSDIVAALDNSYVVIQGPPGTGKSTSGAHVIVDLLAAGKRVALAAQSHKALHNLLKKVEETAASRGVIFAGCHKSTASRLDSGYASCLEPAFIKNAPKFALAAGCGLVSATTFAWADATQRAAFDVVVIDEAGQIALADALVTSLIARNVVLLGDPQQLPQVAQGSHPVGTDSSILEHLLGSRATIPVDRGVFLDTSYRMQPGIDHFVSHAFYDGRLHADGLNANNSITVAGDVQSGVRYVEVKHEGNARKSIEEADFIVSEISRLLEAGSVTIRDRATRPLTVSDILVVAPYNVQRIEISERLERRGIYGIGVGTVDKFQGQEAPVVFYSMTTSSADLAPRGLEFLLSPNRFNVAISRAQALSVVVCSSSLLASRARTIEHMRMLDVLCAYAEDAAQPPVSTREMAVV